MIYCSLLMTMSQQQHLRMIVSLHRIIFRQSTSNDILFSLDNNIPATTFAADCQSSSNDLLFSFDDVVTARTSPGDRQTRFRISGRIPRLPFFRESNLEIRKEVAARESQIPSFAVSKFFSVKFGFGQEFVVN